MKTEQKKMKDLYFKQTKNTCQVLGTFFSLQLEIVIYIVVFSVTLARII